MNKKADFILTKVFVGLILFCIVFISIFVLYNDVKTDYSTIANITTDSKMDDINKKVNESFNTLHTDSGVLLQSLQDKKGSEDTGEGSTLVSGLFGTMKFIYNSFHMIGDSGLIPQIASSLGIPNIFWMGAIAILAIVIFIVVIAGFMKAANW